MALHPQLPLDCGVPVVLNGVVGPSDQHLGHLGPFVTVGGVG